MDHRRAPVGVGEEVPQCVTEGEEVFVIRVPFGKYRSVRPHIQTGEPDSDRPRRLSTSCIFRI